MADTAYSSNSASRLADLKSEIARLTIEVYDVAGMSEVIKSRDAAMAELSRRRRDGLARDGWIV